MSTILDPVATYDCLFLGSRLHRRLDGFTPPELHLFAYLACLLSLYRHSPLTDWGYNFIGNDLGAPFSSEIDAAIRGLIERGDFIESDERLRLSDEGARELEFLSSLQIFKERSECLNGSGSSLVAFSVGIVREALSQEPELSRAKALASTRQLLDGPGIELLYEQFQSLYSALGNSSADLRLPAVAWLTALFREASSKA